MHERRDQRRGVGVSRPSFVVPVPALDIEFCLKGVGADLRLSGRLRASNQGALGEGEKGCTVLEAVVLAAHPLHVHNNIRLTLIPGQGLVVVVRQDRGGD